MNEKTSNPEASDSEDTLYDVSDSIATITLNRPEKMNTLGGEFR